MATWHPKVEQSEASCCFFVYCLLDECAVLSVVQLLRAFCWQPTVVTTALRAVPASNTRNKRKFTSALVPVAISCHHIRPRRNKLPPH